MGSNIPMVRLGSSNVDIPLIGFGTAGWPFSAPEAIKEAILNAIELGYRHFDSAATYHSEKPLGEAIAEALHRGLINSRGELFITSKLWCCDAHYDRVLPALQMSLRVALRWVYEQGVIFMVVKSFNKERMKENLEFFDWELTQEVYILEDDQ